MHSLYTCVYYSLGIFFFFFTKFCVMYTKLDIYICITITGSIPLLVDYKSNLICFVTAYNLLYCPMK